MIVLRELSKFYRTTEVETVALDKVDIEIAAGDFVAIMGPSGCGKSTLMNILGLLDAPSEGRYEFFGHDVSHASEDQMTVLRRQKVGFVFQSFNLIDDLTVAENVEVALIYRGVSASERRRRVADALEKVDLAHRAKHRPRQLSGGQQQRVAVARALVSNPDIILADEPTGNLDTANGEAVMALLRQAADAGVTVVMVTHSITHAAEARRTIKLLDGRVVNETIAGV